MQSYRGRTVVVTGASSGLGTEFAVQLAERGADVVLVARRADRLDALAEELADRFGVTATPIPMDLAAPAPEKRLRGALAARGIRVDGLVNNAGFGLRGPFADADPERVAAMVRLNVDAVVALSQEFLPDLTRSPTGLLVNVASVAAYQPCPGMAVYGATKAFVLSFTEALARESAHTGLRVLALNPGAAGTEFFEVAGSAPSRMRYQTPERVVAAAMRALERRRTPPSTTVGAGNTIASKLVGLMPRRLVLDIGARLLGDA
jgi:uncharacterized protein